MHAAASGPVLATASRHTSNSSLHNFIPLHRSQKQVRTFAVKVDGEGWVGVSADIGRCHGHAHPTPELAKLCALHRARPAGADDNVVLMPVRPSLPRERKRAAGDRRG